MIFGYQAIIEWNFHFRDEITQLYRTLYNSDLGSLNMYSVNEIGYCTASAFDYICQVVTAV